MQPRSDHRTSTFSIAIRRPVTMVMLFLTLIVFGWRSYQQLPINLMPDISYPTLTVRTEYEGAAPEDVEKLVTRPLEEMLAIVGGVVEISSVSSAGLSEIILEFAWGTEMNVAQQDVRDRLDLFEPPREVTEKPVILRYDPTLDPVMRVAITSTLATDSASPGFAQESALTSIRDAAERHLKSDLEAEPGIAQVEIKGGQEEEIQILVDAQRLKGLGLTPQNIVDSLAQQNINLSGGRLKEGKTEYLVRTLNEFETVDEIGASIILTPSGQQLRLSDVADVLLGTKEREAIVRINGREAVGLDIYREGDANTVEVANKVKDLLAIPREFGMVERATQFLNARMKMAADLGKDPTPEELETQKRLQELAARRATLLDRLPSEIDLTVISDQSRFIVGSIKEVQNAAIDGGLLALIVLFIFLKEFKTTSIIGVTIPISVIATFVPMFSQGISLNVMSLGGLALGIGMLVDCSIVVLESIFRCKEEGDNAVEAAMRGTHEVGMAVVASTLTTVCVFFPMVFVEGIAGQMFGDMALTVTFSLLASTLVALYLIPLLASRTGFNLDSDRDVVWITRAVKENRASGRGFLQGLALLVPMLARYIGEYFRDVTSDVFGPSIVTIRAFTAAPALRRLPGAALAVLMMPFLLALFLVQVLLKFIATIAITVLFASAVVITGLIFVIRKVFMAVMWLPLLLFDKFFNGFRAAYGAVLDRTLSFAPIFLLAMLGISAHAFWLARDFGTELIPEVKQGEFGIRMEAPAGTRLEETEQRVRRIEEVLERWQARGIIDTITVEIGEEDERGGENRGENVAEITVLLENPEERAKEQDAIMDQLRDELQYAISGDDITFTLPSLFTFRTAVELQVLGDDLGMLKEIGEQALERVSQVPGVVDAELSVKSGYPEVIIQLDREKLASRGLTPGQVAQRLRTEVQGDVPTRFNRAGEKLDIRVRTNQSMLSSVQDLRQLNVGGGVPAVPLQDVATIEVQEGPSEIRRIDQRQVVLVSANIAGRDIGAVSEEIMLAVEDIEKPRDFMFLPGGEFRELEQSRNSMVLALVLAIFLVYVVMACQFESIIHPALIMFTVPLGFVGVIYALWWTETTVNVMVFLGAIILAGMVVNNAIVLVDYINILRSRGIPKKKAIVEAGKVRLRPILMTAITTILGLVPMAFGQGEGAEMWKPLAITVISGLSFCTILTLLVIPAVYYMFGGRDKNLPEPT